MEFLSKTEERIIGSLIEKKFSTPEYYPLTLNALKNACNQKSSREPVTNYTEADIEQELESLFEKKMVFRVSGADHRVPKYNENFTEFFNLTKPETAVMCVLMLRGHQTPGEIKSRSGRIYEFKNLQEVETTLNSLINRGGELKFAAKLPRNSGRESRYASVLSGEPQAIEIKQIEEEKEDKIKILELQIEELRDEIERIKKEFAEFKKQFE
ncbi:MAG: YceH family protein [Melioribacteraceae bacterium]|nr:YceH family protein [Melioribacteraceae bacterium]